MTDEKRAEQREILNLVYDALKFKGYNPIDQIVGYMVTNDPSYVTTYNNARNILANADRDYLLEEVLLEYFRNKE